MDKSQAASGIKEYIKEYLETLDDVHFDERYHTDRGFTRGELIAFVEWLDGRDYDWEEVKRLIP
jgi:hypothetical protein